LYKVELTEKEVREVGVERYIKTVWKRKVITFIVGFASLIPGAIYWEQYLIAKIWLVVAGIVWLGVTLYQVRKEGKAGKQFLEDIKAK